MDPPGDLTVSVVVPTYGRSALLPDALRSVGEQTYDDIELVVVDDHSPEPVAPLVADLDLGTGSVTVIRHDENRGANAARNTGIEASSGEFVAFLDDDDYWRPETLERQLRTLLAGGPEVGLVTVGMRIVDGTGEPIGLTLPTISPDDHPVDALASGASVGSFSRLMVRRTAIDAAGLTDERFPCWQDWEWEFRLANHCRFTSIDEPLVVRRQTDADQITDNFDARRSVAYPLLREKHRATAAARGLAVERAFEAELARTLGASALPAGEYVTGIRYLLRALRYEPTDARTYLYLALAAGGPLSYRLAVGVKRRFADHVPNL